MLSDQSESFRVADLEHLVAVEQAAFLCGNLSFALPTSGLLALSAACILWNNINCYSIAAWLSVVFVTIILRTIHLTKYHDIIKRNIEFNAKKFLKINVFGSFAMGVLWGVLCLGFLNATDVHFAPLIIILCGITSGSSLQGAPSLPGALAFNIPVLLMIAIKLMLSMTQGIYFVMGDLFLYFLYIVRVGRRAEQRFTASSRLKHRETALTESLKIEHSASMLANQRLFQLANHDSLTGLSNRAAFSKELDDWLEGARQGKQSISLFLIDLDHFKSINDTLGHRAGDDVLKEVAARLRSATDPAHVVARLGGDEFAILARGGAEISDLAACHLIDVVNGLFMAGEHPVTIGISIGIASYPGDDCSTGDDLLARSDLALYAAKAAGRHGSKRFDQSMLAKAELSRAIEHDLPYALKKGAIEVRYQPQVALADGTLVGLEALIRWDHPTFSWIAPPAIVAAALRTNMSRELTGYVLAEANRMIGHLEALGLGGVLVSVNISPNELDRYVLPELLRDMIAHHGLDPRRLELEITEDAFVSSDNAIATLNTISAMGIRLSIDDFGTGCSSIAYFRTLMVDRIKIDRSFVTGFTEQESDRILVQTMLGIGRSLNIEIVAEGVETEAEASLLRELGCPIAQGFFFARPLSPAALDAWILARSDNDVIEVDTRVQRLKQTLQVGSR